MTQKKNNGNDTPLRVFKDAAEAKQTAKEVLGDLLTLRGCGWKWKKDESDMVGTPNIQFRVSQILATREFDRLTAALREAGFGGVGCAFDGRGMDVAVECSLEGVESKPSPFDAEDDGKEDDDSDIYAEEKGNNVKGGHRRIADARYKIPAKAKDLPAQVYRTLSIKQEFACNIAIGYKRIENRTWGADVRGPVAMHVSGKFLPEFSDMPVGVIVGILDIAEVLPWKEALEKYPAQADFIAKTKGNLCWIIRSYTPLREPVPAKGRLSLWPSPEIAVPNWKAWTWLDAPQA